MFSHCNARTQGFIDGTVIFPKADVKLFLMVNPEERARRRQQEYLDKGIPCVFQELYQNIVTRDQRDQNRVNDPLRPAHDAHILDIDQEGKEDVFAMARGLIDPLFAQDGTKIKEQR